MASPLPEPYQLQDVLTDGAVLTCLATIREEEVLVHVLPADPGAREKVLSRLARAPRNPNFLDRLDHEGHALIVTRRVQEMENFEGWLDEVSPERVDKEDGAPTAAGPTRLVLDIRAAAGPRAGDSPGSASSAARSDPEEPTTVEREAPASPPAEAPSSADGEEAPRKTALHLSAFVPAGGEADDAGTPGPPADQGGTAAGPDGSTFSGEEEVASPGRREVVDTKPSRSDQPEDPRVGRPEAPVTPRGPRGGVQWLQGWGPRAVVVGLSVIVLFAFLLWWLLS